MVLQTELRPAWVDPLPAGRGQTRRMMLATATLIDGYVDTNPGRFHPYLANTYLMADARLLIAGTRCRRPLYLREFADVCRPSGLDGLIVRLQDESGSAVSFDVKPAGDDRMLCAYRLWMPQPSGAAWLVPSMGEGPFVRLDPLGIELVIEPPFSCEIERYRGLKFGAEFMSVAATGWF